MADFGISELAIALSAAGAAAAGGTSILGAQDKNKAVKKAQNDARLAAYEKAKQVKESADLERSKRARESDRIRGRIAVIGGASGADPSGSYAALDRQVTADDSLAFDVINRNQQNEIARIASGLNAEETAFGNTRRNPLLDGFAGAIQGGETGLSLYNALPASKPDTRTFDENDFFP